MHLGPTQSSDPQASDGRSRLVEATISCIADYGYKATTVRKIAERAKVTAGLVTHHFSSKDALVVEAYRRINAAALERMAGAIEVGSEKPGAGSLRAAADGAVRALFPEDPRDPRQMRIMVAFWGLAMTEPQIAAIQRSTYDALHAHLVRLVGRVAAEPEDATKIATGIMAVANGLWLECCLSPERLRPEDAVDVATRFARSAIEEGAVSSER